MTDKLIPATEWSSAVLPLMEHGHYFKLPIEGLSMYPLLSGGRDEVLIASILGKQLKRCDIVLFVRKDGTHVLHRIHHTKNKMYYMLGDSQTCIEGPIKEENILAVAIAVIRNERMISFDKYSYRVLSNLWLFMRPMRPFMLRIIQKVCRFAQTRGYL